MRMDHGIPSVDLNGDWSFASHRGPLPIECTCAADLARASRPDSQQAPQFIKDWVEWGAGPRAAQYFVLGAKVRALINGRFNVSCSDVRSVAHPVLRHRIITNFNADSAGVTVEDVIARLLKTIPEPGEAAYARRPGQRQKRAAAAAREAKKNQ